MTRGFWGEGFGVQHVTQLPYPTQTNVRHHTHKTNQRPESIYPLGAQGLPQSCQFVFVTPLGITFLPPGYLTSMRNLIGYLKCGYHSDFKYPIRFQNELFFTLWGLFLNRVNATLKKKSTQRVKELRSLVRL